VTAARGGTVAILGLVASLASSAANADEPPPPVNDWVDGPSAPLSPPSTLPPAVAPRETAPPPADALVMPQVPPEDARVAVDDGLLPVVPSTAPVVTLSRREAAATPALDLETALALRPVPGLWMLPADAGQARLSLRGMPAEDTLVVVNDVPLIDGGGLVSATEVLSLLAPATLTFAVGPRVDAAGLPAAGGAVFVDDGGALVDVGESARVDGWLGGGTGGADGEKGVFTLVRSGWRTLRVTAHATLLQRDDLRTGRMPAQLPLVVDTAAGVQPFTAGGGGTVGARVDVVPFDRARLFVSWLAGRSLDTYTPADVDDGRPGCGVVDPSGRPLDCVRVRERGADVAIVGLDVRRELGAVSLQPSLRLHAQRTIVDVERSGVARRSVDRARDEDDRAGLRAALTVRPPDVQLLQRFSPRVVVALDAFADHLQSTFASRSTRGRDAEPPGDGLFDPSRARFVDGAVGRTASLGLTLHAAPAGDDDPVGLQANARVVASSLDAPSSVGRLDDDDVQARAAGQVAPSFDAGARARVWRDRQATATLALWAVAGQLGQSETVAAQLRGPAFGVDVGADTVANTDGAVVVSSPAPPGVRALAFGQGGAAFASPFADADVTLFSSTGRGGLRALGAEDGTLAWRRGRDVWRRGVQGAATLRPADGTVQARIVAAGVVVDELGDDGLVGALVDERPLAGVVQPQGAISLRWSPPSSSAVPGRFSFVGGVRGALPRTRLSASEQTDRALCPELPQNVDVEQARPCSGDPGFALFDVGASFAVGQLRIDVAGENVFDVQGTWRGAQLGTGGTAVRARAAFVF
jgi:hypothetical protein